MRAFVEREVKKKRKETLFRRFRFQKDEEKSERENINNYLYLLADIP
jgi:hypothetical protein